MAHKGLLETKESQVTDWEKGTTAVCVCVHVYTPVHVPYPVFLQHLSCCKGWLALCIVTTGPDTSESPPLAIWWQRMTINRLTENEF